MKLLTLVNMTVNREKMQNGGEHDCQKVKDDFFQGLILDIVKNYPLFFYKAGKAHFSQYAQS